MDCTLALVADAANISEEGKLNVLGSFENIVASDFPYQHRHMVLVMRFNASREEVGQTQQLEVGLLDPEGETVGTVSGKFAVLDGPGRRTMGYVLPIEDITFEREGDYSFTITLNGDAKGGVDIRIVDSNANAE